MRIAVAGFQHETNSFAAVNATLENFLEPDAWPGLLRGAEMPGAVAGMNIPVSGFIAEAERLGHEIVPLLWCSANPSAEVTEHAYETIHGWLIEEIDKSGAFDALYLDLHGAMVTTHLQDGEGELLNRLRTRLGRSLPIVASLDFHANVTGAMVREADLLVAYRTYPHIDMAETGARVARLLHDLPAKPLARCVRKLPFLIPLIWQSSLAEPTKSLMQAAAEAEHGIGIRSVSFVPGFAPSDIEECGPAVLVYGDDESAVARTAEILYGQVLAAERGFSGAVYAPEAAVRRAIARPGHVILADTQDNPGAGGSSDTVGLLRALIELDARDSVLGLLCDPAAAAAAHAAGVGAEIELALGAHSGMPVEEPIRARFRVGALGDGNFDATGAFYAGCHMELGPMARLEIGGVTVAVSSRKQQAADQAMFRHLGIEPREKKILALKSSVHFRADFAALAEEILIVEAPGAHISDPERLAYRHLRSGLRIGPMGPVFANKIERLDLPSRELPRHSNISG